MSEAIQWSPGDHHGLAWPGAVALIDDSVDPGMAERLWVMLSDGFDLGRFVTALGEVTGRSLIDLPTFAIAVRSNGVVHLAARGDLVASATTVDGQHQVHGGGMTTWAEGRAQSPASMTVASSEGEPSDPTRPLVAGVVPASTLRIPVGIELPDGRVELPDVAAEAVDEPRDVQPPESVPVVAPEDPEFGDLWGEHTIMRSVEEAAVRTRDAASQNAEGPRPSVAPTEPAGMAQSAPDEVTRVEREDLGVDPDPVLGDHDGATIIRRAPLTTSQSAAKLPDAGVTVPALICSLGHASPPDSQVCRACAEPLSGPVEMAARPGLGRLVTSDGDVIELTGPVVVGRDPRAARFQGTEIPRLVELPHSHVSASHVSVRLEDWDVVASDLRSTNGTYLRRPGQPPVRMAETAVSLSDGDVIDLGHGVNLSFEAGS